MLVVLLVLRGGVGGDDDRLRVEHLVEQLVHRQDLLERLLERDVVEV